MTCLLQQKAMMDTLVESSVNTRKRPAKELCEEARKRWREKGKGKESRSRWLVESPARFLIFNFIRCR